jgi:hypothetical protein
MSAPATLYGYTAPQNLQTGALMSKIIFNIVIIGGTLVVLARGLKNVMNNSF